MLSVLTYHILVLTSLDGLEFNGINCTFMRVCGHSLSSVYCIFERIANNNTLKYNYSSTSLVNDLSKYFYWLFRWKENKNCVISLVVYSIIVTMDFIKLRFLAKRGWLRLLRRLLSIFHCSHGCFNNMRNSILLVNVGKALI